MNNVVWMNPVARCSTIKHATHTICYIPGQWASHSHPGWRLSKRGTPNKGEGFTGRPLQSGARKAGMGGCIPLFAPLFLPSQATPRPMSLASLLYPFSLVPHSQLCPLSCLAPGCLFWHAGAAEGYCLTKPKHPISALPPNKMI